MISKMGISTIQSYCGAQIFEAVGLARELVDRHFTGTPSRIGGIGLEELAERGARPPRARLPGHARRAAAGRRLYAWRRDGERHHWNPETIALLQHAVRARRRETYEEYAQRVNDERRAARRCAACSLPRSAGRRRCRSTRSSRRTEIVKRFATGAMSLGSLSREAHETLAIAMNRIGGRSNTGEGGEDPARYIADPNGDSRRSAIKQVASGRFGVTSHYLVNADELQIKIAQGAKPGEGGQLPGPQGRPLHRERAPPTPGVGLISPPPHHDIYSIEDLAQLIYDLRCATRARASR